MQSNLSQRLLRKEKCCPRQWIYKQCMKGSEHKIIVAELVRRASAQKWRIVRTKQRIQQIGKEYAEIHGLLPHAASTRR